MGRGVARLAAGPAAQRSARPGPACHVGWLEPTHPTRAFPAPPWNDPAGRAGRKRAAGGRARQVVDFPAFIVCDDKGNDFFKEFNL